MKVQIKKAEELHQVVSAAANFHDESVFNLNENGILQELEHPSGASAYASLIPKDAMETYDVDPGTRLGVKIGELMTILPNNDKSLTLDIQVGSGVHKINMTIGTRTYTMPLVDVDSVSGVPDAVPKLDMPIKIYGELDWLTNFIKEAQTYVYNGNDNQGHYWLSANEGLLYYYAARDDKSMHDYEHWEDYDGYEIDWDALTAANKDTVAIKNPSERKRAEVLYSIDLTRDIDTFGENVRMEFGHGLPLKVVCQTENNVKGSWFISPRFPRDGQLGKVPDRIIEDRSL